MSQLNMSLIMPSTPISLSNGTVSPFAGVVLPSDTIEYIPLGCFDISGVDTKNNLVYTVEAYDRMCRTEVDYVSSLSAFPALIGDVMSDISEQCGITISPSAVFPETLIEYVTGTCREYIGYIAGLMGKNARFNRTGELEFVWFSDTGKTIDKSLQYMGGLIQTGDDSFTIQSITTGTDTNIIASGSGSGISFTNPFITQEISDAILVEIVGSSYNPCECKWRGNPAIQAGDIVTVIDKDDNEITLWVMSRNLKLSGGMYDTFYCYGLSDTATAIDKSPLENKLQKVYTGLLDAISESSELINGAKGGIFRVTDSNSDGVNDGFIISESPDQTVSGKCIVANYEGIGLSQDGGATYVSAITHDGINASAITAGQMTADRIGAGILQSLTGALQINLDEATFLIDKTGAVTKTIIDESGLEVYDKTGSATSSLLEAGVDSAGEANVRATNLKATKYLQAGSHARFEDYGTDRTGVFYV